MILSEYFIRKAAGWPFLKRAWARLHEPRIMSALYAVFYGLSAVFGVWCTVFPPQTIETEVGKVLIAMITVTITVAGLLGVVTVVAGNYWAERAAPMLLTAGVGFWVGLTVYLQVTSSSGNRGLTIFAGIATIMLALLRYRDILATPFSPRKYRLRRHKK